MNKGKLRYSCQDTYLSYAANARNTWNAYKSGVISESNNPDLIIRGSGNLSLDINGITYSTGAVYINKTNWTMHLDKKQKKNVLLHEMGHALGLSHHPSKGDLMYKYTTDVIKLSADDKRSFESSYGLSFYK